MITLPDNWRDTLRIDTAKRTMYLHFVNDSGQYFTYFQLLDPAYSMDATLVQIPERAEHGNAYTLGEQLETIAAEPRDQNWKPAPLPLAGMISLAQYLKSQIKP